MERLIDLFEKYYGSKPTTQQPITGSGSSRQYFRLTDGQHTAIGTIGTSLEENNAFLYATRHFLNCYLPVPQILGVSNDHMAYLQEDLGSVSLYQSIKDGRENHGHYSESEQALLSSAVRLLPQFQIKGGADFDTSYCYPNPRMDAESVMFDLNYFKYCFLKLQPDIDFNEHHLQDDFRQFSDDIDALSRDAKTIILRDFQARNVMLKSSDSKDTPDLYFIDYQGCRIGPPEYDVVSFLWQASAHYPKELRARLLEEYIEAFTSIIPASKDKMRETVKTMALFRTMQVLGAYGFRGLIQKKEYFIQSIPQAKINLHEMLDNGAADGYPYLKEILYKVVEQPGKSQLQTPMTDKTSGGLTVTVYSFSYKKGFPQDESGNGGGYVFDCRSTHNPGKYAQYQQMTGLDAPVIKFLEDDGEITQFLKHVFPLVDHHVERFIERGFSHLMVCFGCTGGQHRSVYCAQHVAELLHARFPNIQIHLIHRERGIETWIEPE